MQHLLAITDHYVTRECIATIKEYGRGIINDTYLVTLAASASESKFILQRLNRKVFSRPDLVMRNLRRIIDHIQAQLQHEAPPDRRWEVLRLRQTRDNKDFCRDRNGDLWRALHFIENSTTREKIENSYQAREAGFALGRFHELISGLEPARLHDPLVGFHITPLYLQHYDQIARTARPEITPALQCCGDFVKEGRQRAGVLEDAKKLKKLRIRPIHGDPKISNIMFDAQTGAAISLIDLDTVKPGLIQYDLGDCLRSCCNQHGEECARPETVSFATEICREFLQGYLAAASHFLNENDYHYMYESIRLIPFELGLRFLTDHLQGNVYFKVENPGQNLSRALVQFHLVRDIERKEREIREMIKAVRQATQRSTAA